MWVADYSHHGGKNDILSVRTRNNPWLVAPVVIQHPNDENPNDNLTDHKHDNHGDDKAEYWQNPDVADLTNSDFIDVAEVTADQHDHPMSLSTPVSSCHCCPGPGVDNVGPLALATIDFPTVAAESADHSIDHSIEASIRIPTIGAEDEGSPVPADIDHRGPLLFPCCGDWLPCQRLRLEGP